MSSKPQSPGSSPLRSPCRGLVLAGGAGKRLGGAKPLVPLAGRPLADYPLQTLAAAGLDPVLVVKRRADVAGLGAPIILDRAAVRHPLAGVVAALRELRVPVLACGCDLPYVTPALAARIAGIEAPLVVPTAGGRLQPLFARYAPGLLPALEAALGEERSMTATVEALRPLVVSEEELGDLGDPEALLAGVNTPAELAQAEARLSP